MNRQQAKEFLPIIQAFAEGKIIEFKSAFGKWTACNDDALFNCPPEDYRIKPEPKYRPFANKYECWQEMQKHQPFGWVRSYYGQFVITTIRDREATIGSKDNFLNYDYILKNYTFADGTPFGIKE